MQRRDRVRTASTSFRRGRRGRPAPAGRRRRAGTAAPAAAATSGRRTGRRRRRERRRRRRRRRSPKTRTATATADRQLFVFPTRYGALFEVDETLTGDVRSVFGSALSVSDDAAVGRSGVVAPASDGGRRRGAGDAAGAAVARDQFRQQQPPRLIDFFLLCSFLVGLHSFIRLGCSCVARLQCTVRIGEPLDTLAHVFFVFFFPTRYYTRESMDTDDRWVFVFLGFILCMYKHYSHGYDSSNGQKKQRIAMNRVAGLFFCFRLKLESRHVAATHKRVRQ